MCDVTLSSGQGICLPACLLDMDFSHAHLLCYQQHMPSTFHFVVWKGKERHCPRLCDDTSGVFTQVCVYFDLRTRSKCCLLCWVFISQENYLFTAALCQQCSAEWGAAAAKKLCQCHNTSLSQYIVMYLMCKGCTCLMVIYTIVIIWIIHSIVASTVSGSFLTDCTFSPGVPSSCQTNMK